MKILVVSDIHANIEAFSAVLSAEKGQYSGFLFLGDITGYGPDPEPCIEMMREIEKYMSPCFLLAGNHDAALTGKVPLSWFNFDAKKSVERTKGMLSSESLLWLDALPSFLEVGEKAWAAHASPLFPLTEYILGGEETEQALSFLAGKNIEICFIGHTHMPAMYFLNSDLNVIYPVSGQTMELKSFPLLLNPGSTGFPRSLHGGRKPRSFLKDQIEPISESRYPAYYGMWDTDAHWFEFKEVRYDRRLVERKIKRFV